MEATREATREDNKTTKQAGQPAPAVACLQGSTVHPHPMLSPCVCLLQVSDFGLSHALDGAASITVPRYGITTHMAPEVLARSQVSRASDVYSFGVVLWQMLSSKRPWEGMGCDAARDAVVNLQQSLKVPVGVAADVAALCTSCMSWHAAARPSMVQVEQKLQKLLAQTNPILLLQDF
jgi:serine/threonine protein kinase